VSRETNFHGNGNRQHFLASFPNRVAAAAETTPGRSGLLVSGRHGTRKASGRGGRSASTQRPASVVKELLENAIDAGSTRIDVGVSHAGSDLIQIVDNGCGIAADDLSLAFASHATSKLNSVEDHFYIDTHGFRGEALASIDRDPDSTCSPFPACGHFTSLH
jgi:hypothetical protein